MIDNKVTEQALKALGTRIKLLRLGRNLLQQEFADMCELNTLTLAAIEEGKDKKISFLTIYQLAKCLEVPVRLLVAGKLEPFYRNLTL